MKVKFLNNPLHRILTPIVVAILVYLLVLLIFDRLSELLENFSPEEFLFLTLLSYLLFESYRLWFMISDNIFKRLRNWAGYSLQIAGTIIINTIIVWLSFMAYYTFYLKISQLANAPIVFLIIFSTVGILFYLFYLSIQFLDKKNKLLLEKQEINRKNIEYELSVFRNRINPQFLYQSLENVITLIRKKDPEYAEQQIDHLAMFYRSILGNRYTEVIGIDQEKEKINHYLKLRDFTYASSICVEWELPSDISLKVVPNTLLQALQLLENSQMIDTHNKLNIKITIEGKYIKLCYNHNPRIHPSQNPIKQLQTLQKNLNFYSDMPVKWEKSTPIASLSIPMIEIQEESLLNIN